MFDMPMAAAKLTMATERFGSETGNQSGGFF
jgi:hypothetical protein